MALVKRLSITLQATASVKKFNNTVWNAVQLALKNRDLPISKWDIACFDELRAI